ncbi:MAG: DUF6492 family protein [Byssovorax sp.]
MSIHSGTPRRRYAIITPSHAPDFERCRVLVESTRLHAPALDHYILVEQRNQRLFAGLRGPRTHVVVTQDILPWWLHQIPFRPKWWLNLKGLPVRAWMIQQIVKLAADAVTDADGYVFIDSDAFLTRPFNPHAAERDGKTPLFREILPAETPSNNQWHEGAARLLGRPVEPRYRTGYVGNIVPWERTNLKALHRHIEQTTGRGWIESLCRLETMSEYVIYGMFCERVLREASGHYFESTIPTLNYWGTAPLDLGALRDLRGQMRSEHIGVMISAKSSTAVESIRRAFEIAA